MIAQGFSPAGPAFFRSRLSLWGGWILHVGLLLLIAGIAVQQAAFDGGSFRLTVNESLHLAAPGALVERQRGLLAPASPPDLQIALEAFDPFLHQEGYAPDRQSRLAVRGPDGSSKQVTLDRAGGARFGQTEIFQGLLSGYSVVLDVPGKGATAIALEELHPRRAAQEVVDASGARIRFRLAAERPLADPAGTGPIELVSEREGARVELAPGAQVPFGDSTARVVGLERWSSFSYSRSPGMPGVLAGFLAILLGCLLLTFPAAVARLGHPTDNVAARVFATRGMEILASDWSRFGGGENTRA